MTPENGKMQVAEEAALSPASPEGPPLGLAPSEQASTGADRRK